MKATSAIWSALAAAVVLIPTASRAGDTVTNRLSLSARFGFNISGNFKGIGSGLVPTSPRLTPDSDAYNYDDGYVGGVGNLRPDRSENYGDQTWYCSYDDSASQIAGNNILLSRLTPGGSASSSSRDAAPTYGAELVYNRQLGFGERWRWGLEAAANYQSISFQDNSSYAVNLNRVTDAYPFAPGTRPPGATPANPYQGAYEAADFLIGDTAVGTTTTVVPGGAVATSKQRFDSDLWGFRLGPYLELALTERLHLWLSGGLAMGLLNASASWSETATLSSGLYGAAGEGNDFDVLWGFQVTADASYDLGKNWSLVGGVQYQNLGDYEHSFGGRQVELNLRNSVFVTLGLGYNF